MNKSELKNGMEFIIRKGNACYIVRNEIYSDSVDSESKILENEVSLKEYIGDLNEDMTNSVNEDYDIMKVFDADGKLIWERQEIDWSKVPVNTKVLVRNNDNQVWSRRYFAKYENGKFYCYRLGGTSWSSGNSIEDYSWKQCKLAEEPKEDITDENLGYLFDEYCSSSSCCSSCNYDGKDTCEWVWLLDNYNVTEK